MRNRIFIIINGVFIVSISYVTLIMNLGTERKYDALKQEMRFIGRDPQDSFHYYHRQFDSASVWVEKWTLGIVKIKKQ